MLRPRCSDPPDTGGFDSLTVPGFRRGGAEDLQTFFTIAPPFGPVLVVLQGAELTVPIKALGSAGRDKLEQVLLWEITPGERPPACRREGESQQTHTSLDLPVTTFSHHRPAPVRHLYKLNITRLMRLKQSPMNILNSI